MKDEGANLEIPTRFPNCVNYDWLQAFLNSIARNNSNKFWHRKLYQTVAQKSFFVNRSYFNWSERTFSHHQLNSLMNPKEIKRSGKEQKLAHIFV